MDDILKIIFYTACAGACIPLGGLMASKGRIKSRWLETEFRHGVIAFGGGVLVAAVALVLVPEGSQFVGNTFISVALVLFGGISFFVVEWNLGSKRREKPQLTAMLLDYLPESLALGGAFAVGSESAILLALFIGLQNLPEGYNAYRELTNGVKPSANQTLLMMALLVPIGPIFAVIGYLFFGDNTLFLGAIMLFASGGILYLIFQDIAPQSRMRKHWAPPLGAVLGFCLGMLGSGLLAH